MTLVVLSEGRHSYLYDEHFFDGVVDQEAKCLVPLRRPGALAHLGKKLKTISLWLSRNSNRTMLHVEF